MNTHEHYSRLVHLGLLVCLSPNLVLAASLYADSFAETNKMSPTVIDPAVDGPPVSFYLGGFITDYSGCTYTSLDSNWTGNMDFGDISLLGSFSAVQDYSCSIPFVTWGGTYGTTFVEVKDRVFSPIGGILRIPFWRLFYGQTYENNATNIVLTWNVVGGLPTSGDLGGGYGTWNIPVQPGWNELSYRLELFFDCDINGQLVETGPFAANCGGFASGELHLVPGALYDMDGNVVDLDALASESTHNYLAPEPVSALLVGAPLALLGLDRVRRNRIWRRARQF